MCNLFFLNLEKEFYQKLLKDCFFNSKDKNNYFVKYYQKKLKKIDKKINILTKTSGDVIFFKDKSLDNYNPYFKN